MNRRGSVGLSLLFSILCAVSVSGRQLEQHEPLPLRNWEVRFIPVAPDREREASSERDIATHAIPTAASHFIATVPCRVVDTRNPDGSYGGPKLAQGATRTFEIDAGPCAGIPSSAAAYSLSIGVTEAVGNGAYLTIWPSGGTQPGVATITWNEGQTLTTAAVVPAGTNGAVDVFSANYTHMTIDINGYFVEGVVTSVTPAAGLAGGGTGPVSVGIANGGIGQAQLGASAVTTGAIQDGAVTAAKISNDQVVKSIHGLRDSVDVVGAGGASISADGSTLTVDVSRVTGYGQVMVRWGTTAAPRGTSLLYAGFAFGGYHTHSGRESLCLKGGDTAAATTAGDPLYPSTTGGFTPPGIGASKLIRCAVFLPPRPAFVLWGSWSGPGGWTQLYRGYGMSGHYTHPGSSSARHCMESDAFDATFGDTSGVNDLWYPTNFQTVPAGQGYTAGTYVKCSVWMLSP